MKWILYNLLFAIVYPFLLPGFLVRMIRRGGYAARMGDRFALYPASVVDVFARWPADEPRPIWIHAVSVGEVQVAGQLMREWRAVEPGVRFCFSTTSSTGWKTAEKEMSERDVLIYNPLDFPTFVTAALRTVRPRAVILTETELWPNFIRRAKKAKLPIYLVNARVSDRSAPRYAKARFFFGDILNCFTKIFAQSDLDRDRLLAAGAPSSRVSVTGSFKFDVAKRNPGKETELSAWLFGGAKPAGRMVLLGGSTWPGEDEMLLRLLADRRAAGRSLPQLVLAPRHFEKADAVEANIRAAGFACVRRSRGETGEAAGDVVWLADTTGELMGLYALADVVFVGKSLCAHGSQNMIEPCLCGKQVFVGPYTENFRPVMSDLLAARAIVQAADESDLVQRMNAALDGDSSCVEIAARARAAVENRRGVVRRCLDEIRSGVCVR